MNENQSSLIESQDSNFFLSVQKSPFQVVVPNPKRGQENSHQKKQQIIEAESQSLLEQIKYFDFNELPVQTP